MKMNKGKWLHLQKLETEKVKQSNHQYNNEEYIRIGEIIISRVFIGKPKNQP